MARSAARLAKKLLEMEQQIRALDQSSKTLRERRAETRAHLLEVVDLVPGEDHVIGGIRVRRRVVEGRITYDITAAFEDGVVTDAQLDPYERTGEPYEVWTVTPAVTAAEAEAAAKEILAS